MKIGEFLTEEDVIADLRGASKGQVLRELAAMAAARTGLDRDEVTNAIIKREELGSTGVGDGVAIPHARFDALQKPFGLLARLRKPAEFEAVDGKPVDVVFLLLAPSNPAGDQLTALACIARALKISSVVKNVRHAKGTAAIYEAINAADAV